jgi:hypothetical protein
MSFTHRHVHTYTQTYNLLQPQELNWTQLILKEYLMKFTNLKVGELKKILERFEQDERCLSNVVERLFSSPLPVFPSSC